MAVVKLVAKGRDIVTNRILGAGTEPKYVHWGTGTVAPVDSNAALGTPSAEARTAGASSRVTTVTANDTYRVVGTLTATATRAITEAGLFDASTNGNMFIRGTFDPINLASGDSIEFTIDAVFTAPA